MAILLVSEERRNCEVLRRYLSHWGSGQILDARNAADGVRRIDQVGRPIRAIFCDLELPHLECIHLLKEVEARPAMQSCVFIGMSSDLLGSRLAAIRERHPRIDGWILKPFGERSFHSALSNALRARASARDQIIWFSAALGARAFAEAHLPLPEAGHWRRIIPARDGAELEAAISIAGDRLGALVIEPDTYRLSLPRGWIGRFARSAAGTRSVIAVRSRDPEKLGELRKFGHFFFEPDPRAAPETLEASVLLAMSHRLTRAAELGLAMRRFESLRQAGRSPRALAASARDLLRIDESSVDARAARALAAQSGGRHAAAISHAEAVLASNPCSSRAHWVILRASSARRDPKIAARAREAARFCPRHPALLHEAARALMQVGARDEAERLLGQLRAINPASVRTKELAHELSSSS